MPARRDPMKIKDTRHEEFLKFLNKRIKELEKEEKKFRDKSLEPRKDRVEVIN
jgi:hypothetical protein